MSGKAAPEYMAQGLGTKRVFPSNLTSQPAKKRKTAKKEVTYEDDEDDEIAAAKAHAGLAGKKISEDQCMDIVKPKAAPKKKGEHTEEKRLKRFRQKPPLTYIERLARVRFQRMFLIDRIRRVSEDGTHEEEVFDLAGSTGNIYQITITKVPKCNCPDGRKGNQCKHIIYILVNVLKARVHLAYQAAFLTTELAEIFANAPVTTLSSDQAKEVTDTGGSRKPVEGDCPVCVTEFDDSDKPEDILWCKGACGQNIHRSCFEQWARTKPGQVRCVYCRTAWKGDEDTIKKISKSGAVNHEGYVNVAGELGISTQRDTSTYHQFWVRREFGGGYGDGY